jgi:hypothetical protein
VWCLVYYIGRSEKSRQSKTERQQGAQPLQKRTHSNNTNCLGVLLFFCLCVLKNKNKARTGTKARQQTRQKARHKTANSATLFECVPVIVPRHPTWSTNDAPKIQTDGGL